LQKFAAIHNKTVVGRKAIRDKRATAARQGRIALPFADATLRPRYQFQ